MKYFFSIALFFCTSILLAQTNRMTKFSWLVGGWQMDGQNVYEKWLPVNDTSMGAVSYHLDDDGEQIIDEMIRIVYKQGKYYYIPALTYPDKAKPAEFEIVTLGEKKFVAENLKHDFPQRIGYAWVDATHLYAYIEGLEKGEKKRFDFPFVLKK